MDANNGRKGIINATDVSKTTQAVNAHCCKVANAFTTPLLTRSSRMHARPDQAGHTRTAICQHSLSVYVHSCVSLSLLICLSLSLSLSHR